MAARAIAEREEAVARLEGEKAGLEKLLAEREKEQAQEVSLRLVDFMLLEIYEVAKNISHTMYSCEQSNRNYSCSSHIVNCIFVIYITVELVIYCILFVCYKV